MVINTVPDVARRSSQARPSTLSSALCRPTSERTITTAPPLTSAHECVPPVFRRAEDHAVRLHEHRCDLRGAPTAPSVTASRSRACPTEANVTPLPQPDVK